MSSFPQRSAAAATAIAFAIGTIAIPALHLVLHALPHEHQGGATHYHAVPVQDEHHHEAEEHGHGHEHDRQPFDPEHGAGSAAHFLLAISDTSAEPFVLALSGSAPAAGIAPAGAAFLPAAHVSVARFRGPPFG
jgi:hypothetical protein